MNPGDQTMLLSSMNVGIERKQKRMHEIQEEQVKPNVFNPVINNKSKVLSRGLDTLQEDTHRRMSKQQQLEQNLKKKERIRSA